MVILIMYLSDLTSTKKSIPLDALHEIPFVYRSSSRGEYLYRIPNNVKQSKHRGIMLMAHGCGGSAVNWYPPNSECPQCVGLPEEKSFENFVAKNNFISIAITSTNRESKCWNPQIDTQMVRDILLDFKKEHHIESLPLYAFGGSSGGSFVGSMATNSDIVKALNLKGVIVHIAFIGPNGVAPETLPDSLAVPVLFAPMVRDTRTMDIVEQQMDNLKKKDPDTLSSICTIHPLSIDEMYFHHRIGGKVDAVFSKRMYDGLKENGYLDEEGLLLDDPRRSSWIDIMEKKVGWSVFWHSPETVDKSLMIPLGMAISEEMNVAFSMHEMSTQCNEQIKQFIESIE